MAPKAAIPLLLVLWSAPFSPVALRAWPTLDLAIALTLIPCRLGSLLAASESVILVVDSPVQAHQSLLPTLGQQHDYAQLMVPVEQQHKSFLPTLGQRQDYVQSMVPVEKQLALMDVSLARTTSENDDLQTAAGLAQKDFAPSPALESTMKPCVNAGHLEARCSLGARTRLQEASAQEIVMQCSWLMQRQR